jgi:choline dehydrogenase-like flavoprotein
MKNQFDVIIIGTGTGGGTMAYKLAQSGKKILVIERGNFIPKEKENWDPHEVVTAGRYRPSEKWYDKDDKPFSPFIHYNVGGNSKMYGAAMFRFREKDFEEVKHYGGVSPAWPIDYDVLEPYYTQAEKLYHVHGKRGIDPTEPRTNTEYPYSPLKYEPVIADLSRKMQQIGLRPFPLPMAVKLPQDHEVNEPPVVLGHFDGFPDPTDSKADSWTVALKPAMESGNITLLRNALVEKLETDYSGYSVRKAIVTVDGLRQEFRADVFILAAGAINSAALLLRSASSIYPNGLANNSDQVGRNLMLHHNGCLVAFSKKKNDSVFQKSLGLADFYFGENGSGLPLGEIQLMGRNDPETILWLAEKIFPGKNYQELKESSMDFWLTSEDLPSPGNRVSLRNDGSIRVAYTRTNFTAYELLKEKLKETFVKLGEIDPDFKDTIWNGYDLDVSGVSHQNGTLRFGKDARTSVLDVNCKAHDLDNLYVADASFFPSCGAFNPALTIAANALRVGDHLIKNVFRANTLRKKFQSAILF